MKTRIGKTFRWEMGHRLPYHSGGCENIHGHSYRLWVEVIGEPDEQGMVIDYYEIKAIVQPIIRQLDHSFLCDRSDTILCEFFQQHPHFKVQYVDFPTTAENIAQHILSLLLPHFEQFPNIEEVRVRVAETETTFAEVSARLPNRVKQTQDQQ